VDGSKLAALEEEDGNLAQVEVDEVARLVGHVRPKVPADDAVPRRVVFFVEFFLNVSCNILLYVVLLQSSGGAVHSILLHLFAHVSILDDGFAVCHFGAVAIRREI